MNTQTYTLAWVYTASGSSISPSHLHLLSHGKVLRGSNIHGAAVSYANDEYLLRDPPEGLLEEEALSNSFSSPL